MRKNKLLLLLALLLTAATGPAWAQSTSSLVFEAACNGSGTADDNVVWTVTSDCSESTFDNNKGIHYGTSNAQVQYIQLSTSGISGTITQVVVNASTASNVTATVGVTVDGNAFGGDAQSLSSTATDYTFTGSASGAIVVRVAKPEAAAKALYVKSIEVTYTSSGGSGATYTVAGSNAAMFGAAWDATNTANDMTKNGDGTYSITYTNVNLDADVEYRVVKDHDWSEAYPDGNRVINIAKAGTYTLTIHFNPTTHEVYETMPGSGSGEEAQSYEAKVFDLPASWANDETPISAADMPEDFVKITADEAKALAVPDGGVLLIYGFNGDNVKQMLFNNGTFINEVESSEARGSIILYQTINYIICYPALKPYSVKLKDGVKDADKWTVKVGEGEAQALPIGGLKGDGTETVTLQYNGRLKVKGVKATSDAQPAVWDGDLSKLTAESTAEFATATDGMTIKGALAEGVNVKVSIAEGATVTLDGVTIINGVHNDGSYNWAGINCLGDATIILSGTNTVQGFLEPYPGIHVPVDKTLTIQGSGSLTASSGGNGCGIGGGNGGNGTNCGNIVIAGGTITANGSEGAAGIGSGIMGSCGNISITGGTVNATGSLGTPGIGGGYGGSCGNISITGGTINATGGEGAAGIGGCYYGQCGDITITNGVTSVTATKGDAAPYSIGAGSYGSCGTVTIGGTVYWQDNAAVNGGDTYLATSPLDYPPTPATATTGDIVAGSETALISGGAATGGTMMYKVTTENTKPTSTEGFSADVPTAQTLAAGTYYVWYYVEGDASHTDSEISATGIEVTIAAPAALNLTSPAVGQVIGDDGKNYNYASLPGGVTAVAKICYLDGEHGLALALADEGAMDWSTAISTCAAHTPAFTGGTWKLASKDEWTNMITAAGSHTDLRDGFSGITGASNLQSAYYWSSTENEGNSSNAWYYLFVSGSWGNDASKGLDFINVRACLAW